jgi:hypothetical protein
MLIIDRALGIVDDAIYPRVLSRDVTTTRVVAACVGVCEWLRYVWLCHGDHTGCLYLILPLLYTRQLFYISLT